MLDVLPRLAGIQGAEVACLLHQRIQFRRGPRGDVSTQLRLAGQNDSQPGVLFGRHERQLHEALQRFAVEVLRLVDRQRRRAPVQLTQEAAQSA